MLLSRVGFLKSIRQIIEHNKLGELLLHKGFINDEELQSALEAQKSSKQQLGEIFLENAVISSWQLRFILGRQFVLKTLATVLLFGLSLSSLHGKRAQAAEPINGVITASASYEFNRISHYPKILGSTEKKDGNLKAFTKWTGMFKRFDRQLKQNANLEIIRDWQGDVNQLQGRSMVEMVRGVNRMVNKTKYIRDSNNWGKNDYWATPVEFLQRGGDCEDFAIAKYTALRSLGFPEERLRVAIVQDTVKNIPHAVLIAYTDDGAFILDNQIKRLINAEVKGRYKPIFSINREAWWLHTQKSATRVASVQ